MKALGSQPLHDLQYIGSEFTGTELVVITGSRAHFVMNANHVIITRQVLMTVPTCETIEMFFVNMPGKVVVSQEYIITMKTLRWNLDIPMIHLRHGFPDLWCLWH